MGAQAEIVEVVEMGAPLPAESAPPMFVTAPVLEAPPAVAEYVQPAPVVEYVAPAPAVTYAHATAAPVVEYVAPAPTVAYAAPVTTMTAAPTVFPTATVPIATAPVATATVLPTN